MSITEKIKGVAKEKGLNISQIEKALGLGNGIIARWESSHPTLDKIIAISKYLDVSLSWLAGIEDEVELSEEVVSIKVFDEPAAAGFGTYLTGDDDYEMVDFPAVDVPNHTDCGIRIKGRSMEPKIYSGDIVFLKFTPFIENGEIGIFVYDERSYCKKLDHNSEKRSIRLLSLNSDFEPITVKKGVDFRIVGRVLFT